jgi:hypothetical protein
LAQQWGTSLKAVQQRSRGTRWCWGAEVNWLLQFPWLSPSKPFWSLAASFQTFWEPLRRLPTCIWRHHRSPRYRHSQLLGQKRSLWSLCSSWIHCLRKPAKALETQRPPRLLQLQVLCPQNLKTLIPHPPPAFRLAKETALLLEW